MSALEQEQSSNPNPIMPNTISCFISEQWWVSLPHEFTKRDCNWIIRIAMCQGAKVAPAHLHELLEKWGSEVPTPTPADRIFLITKLYDEELASINRLQEQEIHLTRQCAVSFAIALGFLIHHSDIKSLVDADESYRSRNISGMAFRHIHTQQPKLIWELENEVLGIPRIAKEKEADDE